METFFHKLIKENQIDVISDLLETIPAAILIIKSPDGRIAYANSHARKLFGIQSQEHADLITGTATFKALLPNGKICPNEQLPLVRALFNGETVLNEDLILELADGQTAITKVNAVPLFDETKKIIAAVGVMEDITERRNLDQKLKESLDLYSNIVLASPIAVVLHKNMIVQFINPTGRKMFGATHEGQIVGKSILDFVPKEFHEQTIQRMTQAKTEQAPIVERALIRLDGSRFYATVTSRQLTYKGEPATQIIVQDIDKLKTSEKRYGDLFNSVAEGIILFDAVYDEEGAIFDFCCVEVNPAYERVVGRPRESVINRNLLEFIAKDDLHRMDDYKKVALGGKPIHYETYMVRVEKYFDVYVYCPAPKQLAIMFSDVTERKRLEDVLKRDKETLEKLVIERSHELIAAHTDLERARRLSDIGTLSATIAHELRNPLVAINISTGVIRKKTSDPLIKKPLDNIEKSLAESEQIINNLLLYAKINPPHLEKVTLWDIFKECAANSPCLAKKHIIKNKLDVLKNVSIKADHSQIKEVFHNILNNAYEAMENKKGQIDIWAIEDKDFVKVFVKDNGVGIPKEHLEEVFSPFFTTKPRGTGLGLAVCYQIIHAHGGTIDIESVLRKGTTVSITLPKK